MKTVNKIIKLKNEAKLLSQAEKTRIMDTYDYMCENPGYRRDVRELLKEFPEEEQDIDLYVAIYNYSKENIRFL